MKHRAAMAGTAGFWAVEGGALRVGRMTYHCIPFGFLSPPVIERVD